MLVPLLKLVRPKQWAKSAFVLIGPIYALADPARSLDLAATLWPALLAAIAFSLASSACYVLNDLVDVESDRKHPRKKNRPIASGVVKPETATALIVGLAVASAAVCALIPLPNFWWVAGLIAAYSANVALYSLKIKNHMIADVVSLSLGFVLRVVGGCAAAGVSPSTWLLNCTFFFAMFLAFGKRLGERRTVENVASVRAVQGRYTDELLRMATVVTGVGLLVTYAGYLESKQGVASTMVPGFDGGLNLLWLTIVPATFGLLRSIVLLETGRYDDPTEIFSKDTPMQACAGVFVILTVLPWVLQGRPLVPVG